MGKASSTKKVARAARAGGKSTSKRKNIAFPIAIVALVLAGLGMVAFARTTDPGDGPPAIGDHWHAAYGVYICDRWVANFSDRGADKLGIHTHDDGLMHIHPFLAGAAGKSATVGKFFDQVGMSASSEKIQLPEGGDFGGRTYVSGETTCGGKKANVVMAKWKSALDTEADPKLITDDISGTRFTENFSAFTLAFVPEGTEIPPPPSAADILEKATVDGGAGEPATGAPSDGTTQTPATVPAGQSQTPATDAAGGQGGG